MAGGLGLLLFLGLVVLGIALVLAPLKLFSIHRTLKDILEELRAQRSDRGADRLAEGLSRLNPRA
jgi:hypothetical protein